MKVSSNIWKRKLPTTNWLTTNEAITKKKFGRCLRAYCITLYTSPSLFFCFFQAPAKQTTRRSGEMIMSISYSLSGMLDSPKIIFLNLALKNNWMFPKIMVPPNGWFIMEILIKMDDLGVPSFLETTNCSFVLSLFKHVLTRTQRVCSGSSGSEGTEHSQLGAQAP